MTPKTTLIRSKRISDDHLKLLLEWAREGDAGVWGPTILSLVREVQEHRRKGAK